MSVNLSSLKSSMVDVISKKRLENMEKNLEDNFEGIENGGEMASQAKANIDKKKIEEDTKVIVEMVLSILSDYLIIDSSALKVDIPPPHFKSSKGQFT